MPKITKINKKSNNKSENILQKNKNQVVNRKNKNLQSEKYSTQNEKYQGDNIEIVTQSIQKNLDEDTIDQKLNIVAFDIDLGDTKKNTNTSEDTLKNVSTLQAINEKIKIEAESSMLSGVFEKKSSNISKKLDFYDENIEINKQNQNAAFANGEKNIKIESNNDRIEQIVTKQEPANKIRKKRKQKFFDKILNPFALLSKILRTIRHFILRKKDSENMVHLSNISSVQEQTMRYSIANNLQQNQKNHHSRNDLNNLAKSVIKDAIVGGVKKYDQQIKDGNGKDTNSKNNLSKTGQKR